MAAGTYRTTLTRPGLRPFLWTQFLGAFNDNVFKIIVILLAAIGARPVTRRAPSRSPARCSSCRSCSSPATPATSPTRTASARCSSAIKVFEIVAMALAIPALVVRRASRCMLAVLFLMGTQATFFSPAKYGIVPELAARPKISRARTACSR